MPLKHTFLIQQVLHRKEGKAGKTTTKSVRENKLYVVDIMENYAVTLLSRFITRKRTTEISGKILKKSLNIQ